MIILHNPLDKASRDFVAAYGEGHEIFEYPECVARVPYISAFPSVIYEGRICRLPQSWADVEQWKANVISATEAARGKRTAINAERDRLEAASPFVYDGSEFDYYSLSRERINAAVSAATIAALAGTPTSTVICTWTLANNTMQDMTIADWLAFRQAEVARSGALHETARILKAAVDAALADGATAAEVDALPVWDE